MPRTPVPVKMVTAPVRAIRGGGRGPGKDVAARPSAELVEIRQLRREVAVLRGGDTTEITPDEWSFATWRYRHRKPLAPLYAAAVLAASKVLVLGPSFLPVVGLAAMLVLTAGSVLWVRACSPAPWRTLLDAVPEDVRPWLGKVTSPRAAAVMSTVCALYWWVRPASVKEAAVSAGVAVAAAVAARAYRFRIRPTIVAAQPVVGPAETYRMHIAEQIKDAAVTHVTDVHEVINPNGERIGITLDVAVPPPSKGATALVPQIVGHATTAFGVGLQDVMTEVPRTAAGGGERRFMLTILDRPDANALEQIHPYTGSTFDPDTGIWRHGARADWTASLGQLYDPKRGGYSIHVSGETGGGKSESIELILRNVTSAGVVIPAIVDIDGSYVDWAEVAPVYVTTPEHAAILTANYSDLIQHRKDKKKAMRQIEDGRDVGPLRIYPIDGAHPVWLLVFDEWQFELYRPVTGPIIQAKTKEIVTQQRKVVMPMLAAGQATGLNGGFKGDTDIRTQFQGGTMIAHRNNSDSGHQAFGGNIQVNPSKIPLGLAGALYMTSRADARDAMVRAEWVQKPRDFDHERNIPEAPGDELDILLRGLPGGSPLNVTVIDMAPTSPFAAPWGSPAGQPALPSQPVQAATVSDELMDAIEIWLAEVGDWVRRKDIVTEFRDNQGKASSTKIDEALKQLKYREIVEAEDGKYRARVRTSQ